MSDSDEQSGTYGYLALMQLLGSAQLDARMKPHNRQAFVVLASFADPDGECCVSQARVAERLGVTRQAAQEALRLPERLGYFTSVRRHRRTGAEGSKVFRFNLDLAGAVACPVRWPEGVQAAELAGGCKPKSLQGAQAPELAHKKPSEDTRKEETNACSTRSLADRTNATNDRRSARGQGPAGQQGTQRDGQHPLLLPISGGAAQAPPSERIGTAVAAHNHEQRAAISGRIMSEWFRLDGDELINFLSQKGLDGVLDRAIAAEIEKRGRGVRYIAGAVAKASQGAVTAADILAGRYRRCGTAR